ncbi:MAG: hypothetical protein HEQ22_02690 [Sphingopyxis sp.]
MVAALASASLLAAPAAAKQTAGLQDLVGARGAGGETQLEMRGYSHIETHHDGDRKHGYWWNRDSKQCAHVVTWDGRYQSIENASKSDCNQGGGGGDNAGAAVAAVAGIALIAALASKKHHRDDKDYDQRQTGTFDRGYRDGLYNAPYHNYDRSDAYSSGYQAGVNERNANLGHHYGGGGYQEVGTFMDLNGARAAGADEEMRRRGFANVDSFKSGNTAYSIWNRRASRQCVQMTVADGRVYDIRDIQTHPRCR